MVRNRSFMPNTNRRTHAAPEPRRGQPLCAACIEPLGPSEGVVEDADGVPWQGLLVHPECRRNPEIVTFVGVDNSIQPR